MQFEQNTRAAAVRELATRDAKRRGLKAKEVDAVVACAVGALRCGNSAGFALARAAIYARELASDLKEVAND